MNKKIKLRPASSGEADVLSELAFRSKSHWGYSLAFMNACREELVVNEATIQNIAYRHCVAALDNTCLGFYSLKKLNSNESELEALFVEPHYIGQGIGRQLMRHAIQSAAQDGVECIVVQSDPNARSFYLAAGGEVQGIRESGSIPGRYLPVIHIRTK